MSWHFLERWIEKANQHSTLIGKFWITFLIVCRMVIVASVGDRVYNDEQSEFKCNTLQPGCTNVCFNSFSPISHLRFWSFQILFVATPSVMFVVYSAHQAKVKKLSAKKGRSFDDDEDGQDKEIAGKQRLLSDPRQKQFTTSFKNEGICDGGGPGRCPHNDRSRRSSRRQKRIHSNEADHHSMHLPTLIRLPFAHERRDSKKRNKRSESSSSGVGTFEQKNNGQLVNRNFNNNHNAACPFVWREPTQTENSAPAQQENTDVPPPVEGANRPLTDLIVWMPSSDEEARKNRALNAGPHQAASNQPPNDAIYQNQDHDVTTQEVTYDQYGRQMPTAPPEYPGSYDQPLKGNMVTSKTSLNGFNETMDEKQRLEEKLQMEEAIRQQKRRLVSEMRMKVQIPSFAQHFRWYIANVFIRLALEVAFVVFQVMLFGFNVPELFKCNRWPCPNVVDCFVSRPMEKTIFLWFMFIYGCICVVLNVAELLYLIYAYAAKFAKTRSAKSALNRLNKDAKPVVYQDENGKILCRNPSPFPRGKKRGYLLHPDEIDALEYQRQYLGENLSSDTDNKCGYDGHKKLNRRRNDYRRYVVSAANPIGNRCISKPSTNSRDPLGMVLDSEDERDNVDLEYDMMTTNDIMEEYNDLMNNNDGGADDNNVDNNQDDL